MEEGERGWSSKPDKYVCSRCVQDEALIRLIQERGTVEKCDYCVLTPDVVEVRSLAFDHLMERIAESLSSEFIDAKSEHVPFKRAGRGYQSADRYTTYELIANVIRLEARPEVRKDVIEALPNLTWCRKSPWSLDFGQALRSGWRYFVEEVKYRTRYLFAEPSPSTSDKLAKPETIIQLGRIRTHDNENPFAYLYNAYLTPTRDAAFGINYDRGSGVPGAQILEAIRRIIGRLDLLEKLDSNTIVYRARVHSAHELPSTAADLGPPTSNKAKQANRMSPAGIVMFYGAFDRETAVAETFQPERAGAYSGPRNSDQAIS